MSGRAPGFGEVLGIGEFRALWAAELFSILGDQLARVALALLVFQRTSSAALAALTYALTFAPAVLGGALLSGLADRYPRRRVLVVTDLVRAALAGAMAIPSVPLPALWVLVALLTMSSGPFKAAQLALLPQILTGERYVVGLSLRQITGQAAQLVGFATGGLLLAAVEPHVALAANAATFLASAALIMLGVRARPSALAAAKLRTATERTRAVRAAEPPVGNGRLLPVITLICLAGLFVVPEGVAAPYGAAIGTGAFGVGLLMAADPLGSVIGAWLVARLRVRPSQRSVVLFAAASGIPLALCASGPGLPASIMLWAVSGALSTTYLIQAQAVVVELVPDHRRGRVLGRIATCLYASQGVAIVLGGVAAEATGPFRAVAGAGLLGIVLALCVGAWWRPVARSRRDLVAGSEHRSPSGSEHQMSLLRTTSTSLRVSNRTEPIPTAQMSLFRTTSTSSHANHRTEHDPAAQMSLFRMPGTSFRTDHRTEPVPTAQMSLLRMAGTSSRMDHRTEHDPRENTAQMSLLRTISTSFSTERRSSNRMKSGQMSLLRMAGTSSWAGRHLDAVTGLLRAETRRVRGRRRGTQTPSLWGCLLGTNVGRVIGGRVAIA